MTTTRKSSTPWIAMALLALTGLFALRWPANAQSVPAAGGPDLPPKN